MEQVQSNAYDAWPGILKVKQLIDGHNVLTCYPILMPYVKSLLNNTTAQDIKETASRLFPIKKLLESSEGERGNKRFFESTLKASIQKLSKNKERFLVITPELLPDGSGIALISAAKRMNHNSSSLLILTHNHQVDFKSACQLGADVFQFSPGDSMMSSFDTINDLEIGTDKIMVRGPMGNEVTQLASTTSLRREDMSSLLNPTDFNAHAAVTFSMDQRTFLAMNDARAGFQGNSDSMVEITGYSGNLSDLVMG